MSDSKKDLENKLYTVKYNPDSESHLTPVPESCANCRSKACTFVCPAGVYEWDEENNRLIVNYEDCLECGACRIACEDKSLSWVYPKGTKGVTFKQG